MERWKLGWYGILLSTALLLIIALNWGSPTMAFTTMGVAIATMYFYGEHLKKKGEIFQDERTLRIEGISARKTLRILVLILAFVVVSLAILSQTYSSLKGIYLFALSLMVIISILRLGFRYYYERVM